MASVSELKAYAKNKIVAGEWSPGTAQMFAMTLRDPDRSKEAIAEVRAFVAELLTRYPDQPKEFAPSHERGYALPKAKT